jgi:hypothetical protein
MFISCFDMRFAHRYQVTELVDIDMFTSCHPAPGHVILQSKKKDLGLHLGEDQKGGGLDDEVSLHGNYIPPSLGTKLIGGETVKYAQLGASSSHGDSDV